MKYKLFRPCSDYEVNNKRYMMTPYGATNLVINSKNKVTPYGYLCNKTCVKRRIDNSCGKWKVIIMDFDDPETFLFLRSAGFILRRESPIVP